MRPSFERVFYQLADHEPKRIEQLFCCVDYAADKKKMIARTLKLVNATRRELEKNKSPWEIDTLRGPGGVVLYRLKRRIVARKHAKSEVQAHS